MKSPSSSTTRTITSPWWTSRCCALGTGGAADPCRARSSRHLRRPARVSRMRGPAGRCRPARDDHRSDERSAAAMCYTTGTTGQPEGRALFEPGPCCTRRRRPALGSGRGRAGRRAPVVPMFHATPGRALRCRDGGRQDRVMPGPRLDPEPRRSFRSRTRDHHRRVPTIWMGVLQYLDANPGVHDLVDARCLSAGRRSRSPSSRRRAAPGLRVIHAWWRPRRHRSAPSATCRSNSLTPATRRPTSSAPSRAGRRRSWRSARATKSGLVPGRPDDGRARGPRAVGGVRLLQPRRLPDRFTDDGWPDGRHRRSTRATVSLQDRARI